MTQSSQTMRALKGRAFTRAVSVGFELDSAPHGLKPASVAKGDTARLEGVLFQNETTRDGAILDGAPFQSKIASGTVETEAERSNSKTA